MAEIGSVIENKYKILTQIGKGGMSVVYLAMDKNLNKQWAVKEIRKVARDQNNEYVIQSAIAEANLMKRLDHPCLPRIVDIIDHEDVIYVVMDYIEGDPLSKVLERMGAQSQDVVIEWAKELCGVLDYLHTRNPQIIYRDMKPANIMLQPSGNIKLIDFGIAREYKEQNVADTVSLGTKGYAAPEQFGGKGQTDPRTDIYCLGVTLYHLLTGKNPCEPPYEIYPIRYWNPELSSGLESIILKCTQLNPADRYQSCAELMYALMHYEEMDEAYKLKQKKKLRRFYGAVATTVLCLGVGIGTHMAANHVNNGDYEKAIAAAETATDAETAIKLYQDAIAIKPDETTAFYGMITAMKSDTKFTAEEHEILTKAVNNNLAVLKQQSDYGELNYEIGRTYWYLYDYGKDENNPENDLTKITTSAPWFKEAYNNSKESDSFHSICKTYYDIASFYNNIKLWVMEGSDAGNYVLFYNNLKELVTLSDTEEVEIVNLQLYKLTEDALGSYAKKIRNDGVEQSDMEALLEHVLERTKEIDAQSEKTIEIKEAILDNEELVRSSIENAYAQKNTVTEKTEDTKEEKETESKDSKTDSDSKKK